MVGAGHPCIAGDLDDQPGQVDVLLLQGAAGVESGEQQQVVDEPAHPDGLGLDPAQGVAHLVGHGLGAAPGQLRVAAYPGQRGAQLMARVGHEAAQPGFAALALLQRGLHVSEHLVEGGAELTHFRARVGLGHAVG